MGNGHLSFCPALFEEHTVVGIVKIAQTATERHEAGGEALKANSLAFGLHAFPKRPSVG